MWYYTVNETEIDFQSEPLFDMNDMLWMLTTQGGPYFRTKNTCLFNDNDMKPDL